MSQAQDDANRVLAEAKNAYPLNQAAIDAATKAKAVADEAERKRLAGQ